MPLRSEKRSLLMLGGPPGVGKTTILRILSSSVPDCCTVDADDVWSPGTYAERQLNGRVGIAKVVDAVQAHYDAGGYRVVLAWVFARKEMYRPFLDRFEGIVGQIRLLYIVASPEAVEARLAERGEPEKVSYAWSRLDLIRRLPFMSIDTTCLGPDLVAVMIKDQMQWS